jgi:nucleolar GTP-binding protein
MFSIPTVQDAQGLLDKAYGRAHRITQGNERTRAVKKIVAVNKTLGSTLEGYVKAFPSFDNLHPFYRELIDIVAGIDRLKRSLGALDWARKKIRTITAQAQRAARRQDDPGQVLGQTYGRVSSIINQINDHLLFLDETRRTLRSLPDISLDVPTVIVAGFPNVGKSSLLSLLSSAKPVIAAYPFTTKGLVLGHVRIEGRYETHMLQVVEAPGLLDRPDAQRNAIERQGMLALRYLPDLVVFVIDASLQCGYELQPQLNLLAEVRKTFDVPLMVVENKVDLTGGTTGHFPVSTQTGENVERLREKIIEAVQQRRGQ